MDEITFQYIGFSPSEFVQSYLKELMGRVLEEAPSASCLRVTVSQESENRFSGFVRISSSAAAFFVTASHTRITDLAQLLFQRTQQQLESWKAKRSFPELGPELGEISHELQHWQNRGVYENSRRTC